MINPTYRNQVDLLLQILPLVAKEEVFALKGGTAINLFVRNMPRLSVDIDLTYLPFEDRDTALKGIGRALGKIQEDIEQALPDVAVQPMPQRDGVEAKLTCRGPNAQIKIEVNTVIRGHVFPPRLMDISEAAEAEFGRFVTVKVASQEELFGGKLCAALDRQHPRDLFDVHHLLETEGLTNEIRLGFLACLLSHSRPIHEMIRPNLLDQRTVFQGQFAGMALTPFSYADFEATRRRLVSLIGEGLTTQERDFLLTFKNAEPDWRLLSLPELQNLPAVRWKLQNIRELKMHNPAKHREQLQALAERLAIPL